MRAKRHDATMTIEQVARFFRISARTVRRRVKKHLLPQPIKGTDKPVLFAREAVERHVKKGDRE